MKKLIKSIALTLTLSLGIWTLAVTFSPISSNFQAGAEVSATAFNDLFSAINDNFNAAKAAIEGNEAAIATNTTAIASNADALTELQSESSSAKASAVISRCDDASSAVTRSFNTETGEAVTIDDGVTDGRCVLDFGFDISAAYWQVSPIVPTTIVGASVISGCTPGVGANNTKLFCNNFTIDGTPNAGSFMITLF